MKSVLLLVTHWCRMVRNLGEKAPKVQFAILCLTAAECRLFRTRLMVEQLLGDILLCLMVCIDVE